MSPFMSIITKLLQLNFYQNNSNISDYKHYIVLMHILLS